MQTTLQINNRTLKVKTNDGVHIIAIEFAGQMVTIADTGALALANCLQLNEHHKRELRAAWLHHQTEQALTSSEGLNEAWRA